VIPFEDALDLGVITILIGVAVFFMSIT